MHATEHRAVMIVIDGEGTKIEKVAEGSLSEICRDFGYYTVIHLDGIRGTFETDESGEPRFVSKEGQIYWPDLKKHFPDGLPASCGADVAELTAPHLDLVHRIERHIEQQKARSARLDELAAADRDLFHPHRVDHRLLRTSE